MSKRASFRATMMDIVVDVRIFLHEGVGGRCSTLPPPARAQWDTSDMGLKDFIEYSRMLSRASAQQLEQERLQVHSGTLYVDVNVIHCERRFDDCTRCVALAPLVPAQLLACEDVVEEEEDDVVVVVVSASSSG